MFLKVKSEMHIIDKHLHNTDSDVKQAETLKISSVILFCNIYSLLRPNYRLKYVETHTHIYIYK